MPINASTEVKAYFNHDSINMLPFISAEWNYNLVNTPYATFSGTGNGLDTRSLYTTSNWHKDNSKLSINLSGSGKTTSSFVDQTAIQLFVTPSGNLGSVNLMDVTNFQARASSTISIGSSVQKCYKVVFLAKSISNDIINLSVQAKNDVSPLAGSASLSIDSIDWQKVEFKVGQRPSSGAFVGDPAYSSFDLVFDINNTTLSDLNAWGVLIDQVKIYEITYFDYLYGSLYSTDAPFSFFRPGESYVTSGNSSIASISRPVLNSKAGWNNAMPCSSIVYSPRILFGSESNPLFKNGSLSQFSAYKYFISERTLSPSSLGARYEEVLSVNKIVIKLNISQSKPDNLLVNLSNTTTGVTTAVAVPSSGISDAGVCILYWNGSTWSSNKWAWNADAHSLIPYIDDFGGISVYSGGVKVNGYQAIDQISVTQLSSTSISNYSKYKSGTSADRETDTELRRFQVIEISPRLELDLSSFVIDFDVKKEFDNNNTPLPISAMSANSASISFSNIPLAGVSNAPLSIFSINSNTPTNMSPSAPSVVTPLKGMLVKNVKFYVNYYLPEMSNAVIPAGVFYVDTWDNQDIQTTRVTCFDAMKFLQTVPVMDYVAENKDAVEVFSNIMDLSGFTDYNYDQLYSAIKDKNQKIDMSFFFADSASKTVYSILQEAFLAYQIGCYIDEYGIMNFKNLQSTISNYTSTNTFGDNNVIAGSYNESIKTKIGKVLMRYRSPTIKRSVGINDKSSASSKTSSIFQVAPDIIWQQDSEDFVPFNLLNESMMTSSQNYYSTDQGSFNNLFFATTIDHKGYCVIENEILSVGDLEVRLSASDLNGTIVGNPELHYPSTQAELTAVIGAYSNKVGLSNISVDYTGKHMNVKRGQFGTSSSPHLVMDNVNNAYKVKFITKKIPVGSPNIFIIPDPTISHSLIQVPSSNNEKVLVVANSQDIGYATYSAKFRFPSSAEAVQAGIFFGLSGTSAIDASAYFIEINKIIKANNSIKYQLKFYYVDSSGSTNSLFAQPIDITNSIENDFINEPYDSLHEATMGNFINLKFVNKVGGRAIYVNKARYAIDKFNKNGTPMLPVVWASNISTSNPMPQSFAGKNFGFFSSSKIASSNVELAEVYATESQLDTTSHYYFQSREFLNSIVAGSNITERSFFAQSRPQIFGLNYYDVQLAMTPSIGTDIFKASYSFPYYVNGSQKQTDLIRVKENYLTYSNILSTGFRAKFAIANSSNISVFTKTSPGYQKLSSADLLLSSRGMIILTPQMTVEKVINPQISSEVIEFQSDWVQSKTSAESILKVLARASDSFSKDISISIFGNPFVQVGDVITLSYSLKNISNIAFFVKSVSQTFNNGLQTTLVMNQITFNSGAVSSKSNTYPSSNILGSAPDIISVSPSTGLDTGGTVVTITGSNFSSDSIVLFGNTISPAVSVNLAGTVITATSPASLIDGVVNIFVVSGGMTSQIDNQAGKSSAFTYESPATLIQTISNLQYSVGSLSANTYPVTITWSVSSDVGKNYNYYSLIVGNQELPDAPDSGSHSYTIYLPANETGSIVITPQYISGSISYKGTSVTIPYTITPVVSGVNPPIILSDVSPPSSTVFGAYDVTFTYQLGQNSDSVMVYMDGVSPGNLVKTSSATTIVIPGVSALSHTFYFFGYNSLTSTKSTGNTTRTIDLTNSKPNGGTSGNTLIPPVLSNMLLIVDSVGHITMTVDVNQDLADSPEPSSYSFHVASGSPVYGSSGMGYTGSSGTFAATRPVSLTSGKYRVTVDTPNYPLVLGETYYVYGYAVDGSNKYQQSSFSNTVSATSSAFNANLPKAYIDLVLAPKVTWTSTLAYDKYVIAYSDSTGRVKNDTLVNRGGNYFWQDGTMIGYGTGLSFEDDRYFTTPFFSPGSTLTVSIIGYQNGMYGNASISSHVIPASIPVAVAPRITVSQNISGTHFSWMPDTLSDGTQPWKYAYELYSGNSTAGTLIDTSTATTTTYGSTAITYTTTSNAPLFFRAQAYIGAGGLTGHGPWGTCQYNGSGGV